MLGSLNLLQETARRTAQILGRQSWAVNQLRPLYESLLNWTSGGRGIPWVINGVTYRIDPHHRHRLGKDYDASVAAFLAKQVRPGAICLDVGANVGVYVLQFAHWSGPSGRVFAFEPNPGAREILYRHIELNGLRERVTVVHAAVGDAAGEAVLYAADSDGMSRLGAANRLIADHVCEVTVPVVTLDDYCESEGVVPDWLLIDIEGFEIAALAGARRLLSDRRNDLKVVVEMHPNVWDSANTTRARTEALLDELGMSVMPLTGQRDPLSDHGLVYLERR